MDLVCDVCKGNIFNLHGKLQTDNEVRLIFLDIKM